MVGEQQLRIGNNNYKFQWQKGRVLEVKYLAKTTGGGNTYVQHNNTSSKIWIDSIEQIDIFIEDSSGAEHAFKLENFNFSCRAGHEITLVKLLVNKAKNGLYVSLLNHTTGDVRTKYYLFETLTKPSSVPSCLLVLFFPIAIGSALFSGLFFIYTDELGLGLDLLVLLFFGVIFVIWVVLYLRYQSKKNRRYSRLRNAYNKLPL